MQFITVTIKRDKTHFHVHGGHSEKLLDLMPTKVQIVKAMVFPVVMYGCESWTIKTEHQRTDAFQLFNCGVGVDS